MRARDGGAINDDYRTPPDLYKKLDDEFHFDFDPCPFKADFDGLARKWGKSNFINPPYNAKDKPRFIQRAFEEWKRGATCVLLIPAATSTKQFHDLILPNAEVRFVRGRIRFCKEDFGPLPFGPKHDSMIVIFRGS